MSNELNISGAGEFWENNPGDQRILVRESNSFQKVYFCTGDTSQISDGSNRKINWRFDLSDENANLELLIIFIGRGKTNLDLQLDVHHLAPKSRSRVTVKALLFDSARLNFSGDIMVPRNAQKADTFMRCDSLILSDSARVRTIPALEIVANDVKAGHAASTGKVDLDALFYLQTRGFSEQAARNMLIEAFLLQSVATFSRLSEENQTNLNDKLMSITEDIVL